LTVLRILWEEKRKEPGGEGVKSIMGEEGLLGGAGIGSSHTSREIRHKKKFWKKK